MTYQALAYYSVLPLENPVAEVERHKNFLAPLDFKGRIYISEQGVNGQASASKEAAELYMAWMHQDPRFSHIHFKIHPSHEHIFPKMTVKYRRQLVAIDRPVDFAKKGDSLSPKSWKEMLDAKKEDTLVIDVRNAYEWKVGRFKGAEMPDLETFREFPTYAKELKRRFDPKSTPVMMYCTGGIRCEFFSAVLKEEGFEEVYQLEGGVIGYGIEQGDDHWEGNLFVFDDRLVTPMGKERNPPIAQCLHCNAACDVYHNCANMDCNDLFICCDLCLEPHLGCCSSACKEEGRVRPYQLNAKPFRKFRPEEISVSG